jgi:hypothetical protein
MSVRVFRNAEDVYLTGAGNTPCLRWERVDGRWRSLPADLPDDAERIGPDDVPGDLREELLAFVVRAPPRGGGGGPEGD